MFVPANPAGESGKVWLLRKFQVEPRLAPEEHSCQEIVDEDRKDR
jgi:hypothetical protein